MSALICKMCGGDLEIGEGMTTAKCPYCGTVQTLPKLDSEQRLRLYDRANHYRRANEYDKAMAMYEQILNEDQTDSEAYWSIVLCRYGIEYVEDPASHRRIPTVNRMQYTSVLADEDYKAALRYADVVQAGIYEQEAAAIDRIQKGILQVSHREDPYDIFICYKEADEKGNRTRDSVLACELYHQLAQEGLKVFCSRITLEDKLGMAYEPYIFAALHSARIMIVLGTSPENFQAVWVRNEWSRYLSLIRNGEKKVLIPAYRDMDPYDLPKEFSHLQALDMSRLGFAQDLIRGIRKILGDSGDMFMHSGEFTAPNGNRSRNLNENAVALAGGRVTGYQVSDGKVRRTGWESYGWKIGIALGSVLVLAVLFINSMGFYLRWKLDREETSAKSAEQTGGTDDRPAVPGMGQDQNPVAEFSGILEQFVSRVYQCPAKEVSDSQLAKLRQLTIRRDWEFWQIGYSFEAPVINSDQSFGLNAADGSGGNLVWESFSTEEKLDLSSLYRFPGLKKLDVDCPVTA
ncbi:MAG: TIR domain-containing protein [Lachnospiraceae bacterium]|nr:TIR domain-containing protein [Lachnospiraceae bacterium]